MESEINVEIVLKNKGPARELTLAVKEYLLSIQVLPNSILSKFDLEENLSILHNVEHIIIGDTSSLDRNYVDFKRASVNWYVYTLVTIGPRTDNEEDENGGELCLATQWVLPSSQLYNLWENLHYDDCIKEKLLKYAMTIMEFSDRGIDCNIVGCNKVILLHGPPGTGKTSLCKALAQKLSIRLQMRFSASVLIEINSHSLFSKWFSESGKLVNKMFSKIREYAEDRQMLVCILIDEVESLAHARAQCFSGNEPSDSIRVVNAILTQLDQMKQYPNVLILTTSNMTKAIDIAFIDRADIKQFLGLPSALAMYKIYYSCLQELVKADVINKQHMIDPPNVVHLLKHVTPQNTDVYENSKKLLHICENSEGLSGRSLQKVPFLAHALFLRHVNTAHSMSDFLAAMEKAVEYEKSQRKHFN